MGKEGRVFRKGHIDKTKEWWDQVQRVGMAGMGGKSGEKMETTVLEQQLIFFKEM